MWEAILPILLAFVSLGSFELGTRVRDRVHVIYPFKDPLTLFFFAIALSPVIAALLGHQFLELDYWYAAFAIAFISCYSLAYIRGDFGMVYINVHTIVSPEMPNGGQVVKPIVWYTDPDGMMCLQEQSMKEILKTVIFGIRSPLRLNLSDVRRARQLIVCPIMYPKINLAPIDQVEEKIEETEVVKWHIKFKVRSYSYSTAPMCIDTTEQWLVSSYTQEKLVKEVTRKEAQLLESKVANRTQFIGKSGDLLSEIIGDRTPGAEIYQDLAKRLSPEDGGIEAVGTVRKMMSRQPRQRPMKEKKPRKEKKPEPKPEPKEEEDDDEQ